MSQFPADDRINQLIDGLVHDARPVRRLRPPVIRLSAWLVVLLATTSVVVIAGLRPGVMGRLVSAPVVGEIICLGAASVAAAWIALRAAIPGLDVRAGRLLLVGSIVAGAILSIGQTQLAIGMPLMDFIGTGIHCAASSIIIAAIPALTLAWAIGRGAALHPAWAGATGGLAATIWSYMLMQLRCRVDETAHVIVWHGFPLVIVIAVSATMAIILAWAHRRTLPPV